MSVSCRLVLICDVRLIGGAENLSDEWQPGPFVETYTDHMGRDVRTDAATRATNFPASLAGRLFGTPASQQVRFSTGILDVPWDRELPWTDEPILPASTTLRHAELLVAAPEAENREGQRPGILALHLDVEGATFADAVGVANRLARQRGGQGESALHGALTYKRLRSLHASMCGGVMFPTDDDAGAETESSIYSMIMIDQEPGTGPVELDIEQAYSAASCQDPGKLHASQNALERAASSVERLSRSWSALFLRHGAAFMVHTDPDDAFRRFMPIYFGTLYTDAVMLVRLQMLIVRQMELAAESLLERAAGNPHLGAVSEDFDHLDRSLAINSARYWMRRSESNAGNSIKIVHRIQDAMSFPTRLGALDAHIDGLARLSDADAQKTYLAAQNRLATVVALIGTIAVPVTIAIDGFQLLELAVTPGNMAGLAGAILLLGGGMWTWLSRLLPRT
ncbi:hypothetical protein [Arthrobacter sp. YD2]|uniref:hypothetical protein n=1 Tax=Arthrobacter sp. YD2 TaxID=3058046 RepID=UPI0025B55312|nr:hypothetical protein [Arthrobacter sp. YD2]MDN3905745.1 hypothetical protein [Arthrobacter sp. YD2]